MNGYSDYLITGRLRSGGIGKLLLADNYGALRWHEKHRAHQLTV
jgi:hypothetical protein